MRDPVEPIPSPHASSAFARTYWECSGPPQWQPSSEVARGYDPGRLLSGREDLLGIDRRSHARDARASLAPRGSRLTAAHHRPVEALLGLRSRHGWAMVRSLAMAPTGLLVRLVDVRDPELDEEERRRGRTTFARLCAELGAPRGARPTPSLEREANASAPSSPLAAIGGCVLARRVVADLSHWVNVRPHRPSSRAAQELPVTLVVPCRRGATPGRPSPHGGRSPSRVTLVQIPGTLAPLSDPQPEVLAVALSPAARSRFALAVGIAEA